MSSKLKYILATALTVAFIFGGSCLLKWMALNHDLIEKWSVVIAISGALILLVGLVFHFMLLVVDGVFKSPKKHAPIENELRASMHFAWFPRHSRQRGTLWFSFYTLTEMYVDGQWQIIERK